MNSISGRTLLDLLGALALAAIVAAAAVLNLPAAFTGWRLNAAVRQAALDLKVARTRAIAAGVNHRVRFSLAATAYQPERQDGSAYVASGPPVALPRGVFIAGCTAAGASVTFRPRGHASTFGTLTLRNEAGAQRRLIVDIAGRMRVEK
jgi:Tfp pilus assembly protein FimT